MTQEVTFNVGDRVRVREKRKLAWESLDETKFEFVVQAVYPGMNTILLLDDGSEASSEWFDKVADPVKILTEGVNATIPCTSGS